MAYQSKKNSEAGPLATDPEENRAHVRATIARNLILARTAVGLARQGGEGQPRAITQDELATAAGVSRATIAQIESGEGDIRLSTLIDVSTALGISPMLLFMAEDELKAITELIQQPPSGPSEPNTAEASAAIDSKTIEEMERFKRVGLMNSRARSSAAMMGAMATKNLGLGAAPLIGATIGATLIPGIGALVGGALGALIGNIAAPHTVALEALKEEIRRESERLGDHK